jgi:hypothetical protein
VELSIVMGGTLKEQWMVYLTYESMNSWMVENQLHDVIAGYPPAIRKPLFKLDFLECGIPWYTKFL